VVLHLLMKALLLHLLQRERDAFLAKQSNPSHEKEQILLDTKNQEYQDSCSRSWKLHCKAYYRLVKCKGWHHGPRKSFQYGNLASWPQRRRSWVWGLSLPQHGMPEGSPHWKAPLLTQTHSQTWQKQYYRCRNCNQQNHIA
jgi:hypothetical protein